MLYYRNNIINMDDKNNGTDYVNEESYINIKPIIIKIKNNNPQNQSFVQFNKNILTISNNNKEIKIPGNVNTPFFTNDIDYPPEILNYEYQEKLDFLFNKDKFKSILFKNTEQLNQRKNEMIEIEKKKNAINTKESEKLYSNNVKEVNEKIKKINDEIINNRIYIQTIKEIIDELSYIFKLKASDFSEKGKEKTNIDINKSNNREIKEQINENDKITMKTKIIDFIRFLRNNKDDKKEFLESFQKKYKNSFDNFKKQKMEDRNIILLNELSKLYIDWLLKLNYYDDDDSINTLNTVKNKLFSNDYKIKIETNKKDLENLKNQQKLLETNNISLSESERNSRKDELLKFIHDIEVTKKKIEENNVNIMLNILFPTNFPLTNNIQSSFDRYIKTSSISQKNDYYNTNYSYLNNNTILRTTWLNDVINNPEFTDFIQTVKDFKILNEKKIRNLPDLDSKINTLINDINENIIFKENNYNNPILKLLIDNLKKLLDEKNNYITDLKNIEIFLREIETKFFEIYKIMKDNLKKRNITDSLNNAKEYVKNQMDGTFNEYYKEIEKYKNIHITNYLLKEKINEQLKDFSKFTPFFDSIIKLNFRSTFYDAMYTGLTKDIHSFKSKQKNNESEEDYDDENSDQQNGGAYINENKYDIFDEEIDSFKLYLFTEIITGKINEKNKKEIECSFRSETLGTKLINLTTKTFKNKYQVGFDAYPFISLDYLKKEGLKTTETIKKMNKTQKTKNVKNKTNKRR